MATEITLDKVDKAPVYTIINVHVKITSCGEPVTLETPQRQEIKVSHAMGCAVVQL